MTPTPAWLKICTVLCFGMSSFYLGLDVGGIGASTWPIDLGIFVVMGFFLICDALGVLE